MSVNPGRDLKNEKYSSQFRAYLEFTWHLEMRMSHFSGGTKFDSFFKPALLIRYYRVLTMVYNTQRYWVFGLYPSSGR
jgi:hypothetical protein